MPIVVDVDANSVQLSCHVNTFTCQHTHATTPQEKHMFSNDIVRLHPALHLLADSHMARSWRPHTPLQQTSSRSGTSDSQKLQIVQHLDNFEQHQIVRIQSNGSHILVFVKQVFSHI